MAKHKKITIDTLRETLAEIEKGTTNSRRTINDIFDYHVRSFINDGSTIAIATGVAGSATVNRDSVAVKSTMLALDVVGTGTVYGAGAGALIGVSAIAKGVVISTAGTGFVLGATKGSIVPLVGTVAGGLVGAGAGVIVGLWTAKKVREEKKELYMEVLSKKNAILYQLGKEKHELESEPEQLLLPQENRYRYILGCLTTMKQLEQCLAT